MSVSRDFQKDSQIPLRLVNSLNPSDWSSEICNLPPAFFLCRISTLTEDAEISAASRQRMIQEMAMLEARGDEAIAKLRDAEENIDNLQRTLDAVRKENEVRVVLGWVESD